jgi:hypothetical protein
MIEKIKQLVPEMLNRLGDSASRREYLGGSEIGKECPRELWLGWRWCLPLLDDGRRQLIFKMGQSIEDLLVYWFGSQLVSVSPQTKEQLGGNFFGGHLSWHVDGFFVVNGAERNIVLWECKSANSKRFNQLAKNGVLASLNRETDLAYSQWDEAYGAQLQFYMGAMNEGGMEVNHALVTVVNKNTSDVYSEVVTYDPAQYEALKAKAEWILGLSAPPDGAWEANHYKVKNFMNSDDRGVYLGDLTPKKPNCRNCKWSKPNLADKSDKAVWGCKKSRKLLSFEEQLTACSDHQWIHDLVPAICIDEDSATYVRDGAEFTNSSEGFTSTEIAFLCRTDWNFKELETLKSLRHDFSAEMEIM